MHAIEVNSLIAATARVCVGSGSPINQSEAFASSPKYEFRLSLKLFARFIEVFLFSKHFTSIKLVFCARC